MFNKEILGKRIKKVRGKKSQDVFASELGISRGALSFYENGERTPDAEIIYKICDLCNVSADYLLGFTDNSTTDTDLKSVCDYTGLSEDAVRELHYEITMIFNHDSDALSDNFCELKQVRNFLIENGFLRSFGFTYSSLFLNSKSWLDAYKQYELKKAVYPEELEFKCDVDRYNIIKLSEKFSDRFDIRAHGKNESSDYFIDPNETSYLDVKEQVQDNGNHNPTNK